MTYTKHVYFECAQDWFTSLPEDAHLCFCRFTQIGFLRLLTTPAVMGNEVLSQARAWNFYDDWLQVRRLIYIPAVNSHSLSNCSSIQPSTGSASTGKRFCQRLKRSLSRLVEAIAVTPELVAPATLPEIGLAISQLRGNRNSKLRSNATLALSSLPFPEAGCDDSSWP
jgi:hypothetical protein